MPQLSIGPGSEPVAGFDDVATRSLPRSAGTTAHGGAPRHRTTVAAGAVLAVLVALCWLAAGHVHSFAHSSPAPTRPGESAVLAAEPLAAPARAAHRDRDRPAAPALPSPGVGLVPLLVPIPPGGQPYQSPSEPQGPVPLDTLAALFDQPDDARAGLVQHGFVQAVERQWTTYHQVVSIQLIQFATAADAADWCGGEQAALAAETPAPEEQPLPGRPAHPGSVPVGSSALLVHQAPDAHGYVHGEVLAPSGTVVVAVFIAQAAVPPVDSLTALADQQLRRVDTAAAPAPTPTAPAAPRT